MNNIHRLATPFIVATMLSACTLELPTPVSASVERYAKGSPVKTWKLSERQLASVHTWFSQHQSGWSHSFVSYVPNVQVIVQHAGGKQSNINIWSSKKIVVISGGSQLEQDFDASTVQDLLGIVEPGGG